MKTRSLLALALIASLARADLLPPVQDSSSSKGKLSAVTGRATTLPVSPVRKSFVLFNLDALPADVLPGDIANARLRVYFPSVKKPGAVDVLVVTAAWDEKTAALEPAVDALIVATFPAGTVVAKKFVEVEVTATVRAWRAGTRPNFGFALVSDGIATVTLGAKEGAGSGYPCELEVQIDRPGGAPGSVGAAQLADGAVTNAKLASSALTITAGTGLSGGGSVSLGGNTTLSLANGGVTAQQLAAGAAAANLDAGENLGLGLGGAAAQATLQLGGGPVVASAQQLAVLRDGVDGFNRLNIPASIAISGTTAVVVDADSAVTILDISNPARPVLKAELVDGVGGFDLLGNASSVAMSGSLALIGADTDRAVTIVDLTDPAIPVKKAVLQHGVDGYSFEFVTGVAVSGNLGAIVGFGSDAVTFVDLTNPAAPIRRSALRDDSGGFNRLDGAEDVALTTLPGLGLHAIVTAEIDDAVTIIDLSNPSAPALRAELVDGAGGFDWLDAASGVAVSGTLVAVSARFDDAVSLIDISTPTAPVLKAVLRDGVGGFTRLATPSKAAFAGNRLYVPSLSDHALTIVDITNPAQPVLVAELVDGAGGFTALK